MVLLLLRFYQWMAWAWKLFKNLGIALSNKHAKRFQFSTGKRCLILMSMGVAVKCRGYNLGY